MKVGVLQFFSWSRRIPLDHRLRARLRRASRSWTRPGYDCVWLAEHHFNTYSVCPSINVMATHVAARTSGCGSAWPCRWPRSTTRCAWPRRSR